MAKIDVVAKVDGLHAVTGLSLTRGETYTIEEEQFGEEVFERVPEKKKPAAEPNQKPEGEE